MVLAPISSFLTQRAHALNCLQVFREFQQRNKMSEKPKRPLSAYMLWLSENREKIKKENPGIKVTEIAKKGGELWRGMKDKSVSIYPLADYSPSCIFA